MKSENELYLYLESLKNKPLPVPDQSVRILDFGMRNFEEGPDFCQALIQIGDSCRRGGIELHLKSKDWYRHYHHVNPLYTRVLLHLVWQDDLPVQTVFDYEGNSIPTVSLQNIRIPRKTLRAWVCPHHTLLRSFSDLELLGRRRREERQERFFSLIDLYGWNETLYRQLFRNLMYRKNIHLPVLLSWQNLKVQSPSLSPVEQEYMFMYRYGFLPPDPPADEYSRGYFDYMKKSGENNIRQTVPLYGCRPYNYPLRRIAGLLSLLDYFSYDPYGYFFSLWSSENKKMSVKKMINMVHEGMEQHRVSYWHFHSSWAKQVSKRISLIGKQRWKNIVFNTLLPLLYLQAVNLKHLEFANCIEEWIRTMPLMEGNYQERFIAGHIKMKPQNALQQYGLLYMYANCYAGSQKQCYQCLESMA